MARDEDDFIFQKLRQNIQRNFPREDDSDNNFNKPIENSYSNNDSLIILETERNTDKIKDLYQKIDDPELTPAFKRNDIYIKGDDRLFKS